MFNDSKNDLQRSLFDRFDSVVVKDTQSGENVGFNIPDEDLKHCEKIQDEFNLIIENLRDFNALCLSVKAEAENSERYQNFKMMAKDLLYFPEIDFAKKEQKAKQSFIDLISRYFYKKYNLKDINFEKLYQLDNLCYKNILDMIFSEFGDIIDCGVSNLKSDFRQDFVKLSALDEPIPPKLNKNKISLKPYYWYNTNWNHTKYRFEPTNKKYMVFRRALLYFETGVITAEKNMNFPLAAYENWLDFSETYELISEKIKSLKFFKNSRVDIVFKSSEYAKDFFEMFEMSSPIDNRR